jgi:hypothetical protein
VIDCRFQAVVAALNDLRVSNLPRTEGHWIWTSLVVSYWGHRVVDCRFQAVVAALNDLRVSNLQFINRIS